MPEDGDMNNTLDSHLQGCRVVEVPYEPESPRASKKARRRINRERKAAAKQNKKKIKVGNEWCVYSHQ